MEFLMDFEKTSTSTKIGKFLLDNLKTDKENKNCDSITSAKKAIKVFVTTLPV